MPTDFGKQIKDMKDVEQQTLQQQQHQQQQVANT